MSVRGGDYTPLCRELMGAAEDAARFLSAQERRIEYRRSLHTDTELAGFAQLLIDKMRIARLRGESLRASKLQQVAVELSPRVVRDAIAEEQAAAEEADD